MSMGSRISDLRKHNGLTRKKLAEKLNMPETTLRNYELGTREPGHAFLIQIAILFDVTSDYLLELSDNEHSMARLTPSCSLSADEEELISNYRSIDEDGQSHIREIVRMLACNRL